MEDTFPGLRFSFWHGSVLTLVLWLSTASTWYCNCHYPSHCYGHSGSLPHFLSIWLVIWARQVFLKHLLYRWVMNSQGKPFRCFPQFYAHYRKPRRLTLQISSLYLFPIFPLNFSKLSAVVRMWPFFSFALDNSFIHVSPTKRPSPLQAVMKIHLWEKLSWSRSIHAVMFPGKKFIPDNRPQSVCLIPTDTHLFYKETSLWNQWDFRTTHQRRYENQVGANFHFGAKHLYQNNKGIHMFKCISSYWQFKL